MVTWVSFNQSKGLDMSKGFVVWEGASPVDGAPIVMIMTMSTTNRKTGDMVQTWILRQDIDPVEAVKAREDASICGSCVHRGSAERGRSCYVNVGQAPLSVWRKYQRGGYARFTRKDWGLLRGRKVRFGAYGDPGMVPLDRLALLARLSDGWTGYTHQWRDIEEGYADYLMASADSREDYLVARGKGYRSFIVIPKGSAKPEGSVLCMSVARGTSCLDCGACAGTREGAVKGAVSIFIEAHGTGAKWVTA